MAQYALPPTNLGISAAAVSHAFMFPQPAPIMLIPQPLPPPIMVTRIWRRVQYPQPQPRPQPPPLWRPLGQYPYGGVIMTPTPLMPAYHHQYPPRPSGQHVQETTNSNNLDGGDIITTNTSSDDDHNIHDEETDDDEAAADCAVCLDEFYGDVGVLINCGHKFHVGCINEWLKEKNI